MSSHRLTGEGPWVPDESFATRLFAVRREMKLQQGEMARRCGFDDGTWSNWERGIRPRNMGEVVAKVAEVTGCDRNWLMWGYGGSGEGPGSLPSDDRRVYIIPAGHAGSSAVAEAA